MSQGPVRYYEMPAALKAFGEKTNAELDAAGIPRCEHGRTIADLCSTCAYEWDAARKRKRRRRRERLLSEAIAEGIRRALSTRNK